MALDSISFTARGWPVLHLPNYFFAFARSSVLFGCVADYVLLGSPRYRIDTSFGLSDFLWVCKGHESQLKGF